MKVPERTQAIRYHRHHKRAPLLLVLLVLVLLGLDDLLDIYLLPGSRATDKTLEQSIILQPEYKQ